MIWLPPCMRHDMDSVKLSPSHWQMGSTLVLATLVAHCCVWKYYPPVKHYQCAEWAKSNRKSDVFFSWWHANSVSGYDLVCLLSSLKQSIKVVIIFTVKPHILVAYKKWWMIHLGVQGFPIPHTLENCLELVVGLEKVEHQGVWWCCGACVVCLASATLPVSSPVLQSAKSQMWNSNSCKSNTHSLPHSPVDSMWSSCNANSEPVTLSIKYVFVSKNPLKILDLNDKSLITIRSLSIKCLSADNSTNLGVFPIWQIEVNRNIQVWCSNSPLIW